MALQSSTFYWSTVELIDHILKTKTGWDTGIILISFVDVIWKTVLQNFFKA